MSTADPPGSSGPGPAPAAEPSDAHDLDEACGAEDRGGSGARSVEIVAPEDASGRLDKALAAFAPAELGLSRSRVRALIEAGAATRDGAPAGAPSAAVAPGARYVLAIPAPEPIAPQPEAIPLTVAHEDDDLIVIDKPAGMTVHPAPGAPRGTLVNALLAHCGDSLSGVGGALRPGVVHRIDKDTSGLLVVAKTDAAHQGLARQFAAHDIERLYIAFTRGAPDRADPRLSGLPAVSFAPPPWDAEGPAWGRIDAPLARHPGDRKRMAVAAGGRRAVTWFRVLARYPAGAKSGARSGVSAARAGMIACRLETGRTHQIRVHLRHVGHALLGDPVYGVGGPAPAATPPRQALHAATLGFTHPRTGAAMRFESAPPEDLRALEAALAAL